ncbi:MAG: MFS transporter [Rhodospirillaceae bacterium]
MRHGIVKSRGFAFAAATLSLCAVFAASATPIPLYAIYRAEDGLTYADLSLTAVSYFAGAITALLVFGRLSNHLGRRPVSLMSLALAEASCVLLLDVPSATPLIGGRVLLGLACGLASSAIAAFIADNAPPSPWLAPAITCSGPMVGLTIGAIGSGAVIRSGQMVHTLPYLIVMGALAVCAVLVLMARETVSRRPGVLASLRPAIALPEKSRRLFPVACCIFAATWGLGGFYQAFGPSMATDLLGSDDALVSAAVFSSLMAPGAIGGALAGRMPPARAQRLGMICFAAALACVLLSLRAAAVLPFLAASLATGIAQGAVLTASIRGLLAHASMAERAGVFSVIFATSYCGAAFSSFAAGQFARELSLLQVACGFGMLAGLVCAITLVAARNPACFQECAVEENAA